MGKHAKLVGLVRAAVLAFLFQGFESNSVAGKQEWRILKAMCAGWEVPVEFEAFPIASYKWDVELDDTIQDLQNFANVTCRKYFNHANGAQKAAAGDTEKVTLEHFVYEQDRVYSDAMTLNREGMNRATYLKEGFDGYQAVLAEAGESAAGLPCSSAFKANEQYIYRRLRKLRNEIQSVMKVCPALAELDSSMEKARDKTNPALDPSAAQGFKTNSSGVTSEPNVEGKNK